MMRLVSLILLLLVAGCSKEGTGPASGAAAAMTQATALRDKGDFKGASTVLGQALNLPKLSDAQRKDLKFQRDVLRRIKMDYPYTRQGLYNELSDAVQDLTSQEFEQWIGQGRFDSRMIDGQRKFVGTSVNNLFYRYPELRFRRARGKDDVGEQKDRMLLSLAIKKAAREEKTPYVLPHHFICTMTVTVADAAVPRDDRHGKLLRAWLPIPRLYPYQNDFKVIHSSTPIVKLAPETSPIRSAYFEQHTARNLDTRFSITYSYMRSGVYFDLDPQKVCQPDLPEAELKKFTSEAPHVVFTEKIKELADKIAGHETNPMLEAKAFFDWIGSNIKYSYAREYSTLTNISDYCLSNGYGDCGQESLLFITLCRSRGIPARWQSGWDIFPGFKDIHDWSEIYLAPYGWVPVDPWAGLFATRYCTALTPAQRRELHDFYFGGLDYYRMAANDDHSQLLDPPKESLRSDDVDFQRGEVEWGGRDIYFNNYSYNMQVREFGCQPFAVDELKDFPAFADRLARQADPLSVVLWEGLSPEDQLLLKNHEGAGPNLRKAQDVAVDALNGLIEMGEPCIFERERFKGVSLRPETAALLAEKPAGADLSRLNRLLLEDAYAEELSRTQD